LKKDVDIIQRMHEVFLRQKTEARNMNAGNWYSCARRNLPPEADNPYEFDEFPFAHSANLSLCIGVSVCNVDAKTTNPMRAAPTACDAVYEELDSALDDQMVAVKFGSPEDVRHACAVVQDVLQKLIKAQEALNNEVNEEREAAYHSIDSLRDKMSFACDVLCNAMLIACEILRNAMLIMCMWVFSSCVFLIAFCYPLEILCMLLSCIAIRNILAVLLANPPNSHREWSS
jgi:hypothetical protein